jgi:hypothetical protein
MIALTFAALRARWVQALTLTLLAVCATAAAVSGPAYLTGVDRAVVEHELAVARPSERVLAVTATSTRSGSDTTAQFDHAVEVLGNLPGFAPILSSDVTAKNVGTGPSSGSRRMSYRQDVCAHLVIVAGRCVAGGADVIVGERTATAEKLAPGSTVVLGFAKVIKKQLIMTGQPKRFTVVGVYRVPDPHEPYWGLRDYFATERGTPAEPVFTNQASLAGFDHEGQVDTLEAVATPARFAPDRLAQLRRDVAQVQERLAGVEVRTEIPALLDRIDVDRQVTGALIPSAGLPLVLLAWFVIFLAVRYATEARRFELGIVALRGTRVPRRWWLAVGEHLVPVVLGGAVGYLVGPYAVGLLARLRLGVAGTDPHALRYALVAGAGALVAVLVAQARELVSPTADLLRRVPARIRAWHGVAVEAIVLLLAGYAAVQLRVSGARLSGIGLLAPALLVLGIAVLAARGVVPLANRYAARALGRGRVGLALATVQLSRRPGAQRLFVLLVVAVGLLGFAASAADVAAHARADRAQVATGAPRTLRLLPVDTRQLLAGVRAVDPDGRYAMAVARVPSAMAGRPPVLAVDATRLGVAASWRADFSRAPAASMAARLHPDAPAPVVLHGRGVALDVSVADGVPPGLTLSVDVVPVGAGPAATVKLGTLKPGEHTYEGNLPACPGGCRVATITVAGSGALPDGSPITLRNVRTTGPDTVVVSGGQFAAAGRWRAVSGTAASAGSGGLALAFRADSQSGSAASVRPVDTPYPLPVASTAALGTDPQFTGLDGKQVPVTEAARVGGLPALGTNGTLVDLEYVQRLSSTTDAAAAPQVWLGPDAPPDVVDRLSREGLTVTGDQRATAVRADLDRQGSALALWFHVIAAGFAVALAAGGTIVVAAIDRRRRAEDLSALRAQGLGRRAADRAGLLSHLLLAVAATVVGVVAAVTVWWLVGGALPLFVDGWTLWPRPPWPRPAGLLAPWLAAVVVLLGAGVVAAADLRRAVRGNGGGS